MYFSRSYLGELETGVKPPTVEAAARIDEALNAGGALAGLVTSAAPFVVDDELQAVELARRVAVSDIGAETLDRLESAVDRLATTYATTPPAELLPAVRGHLAYVGRLVDARKTLDQHRRLLVVGGWLALLRATVHIDLRQRSAADAHLATAATMAEHAGHTEIQAWCLETRAWDVLTAGDYPQALTLSQQAQAVAPRGSSAYIQAIAQEGRAWARMGRPAETRSALSRVGRLVSSLAVPEQPEHHYRYDLGKALSYLATTLAWIGDPAAVDQARAVIADLEGNGNGARPRRVASARLDLGLALLGAKRPDEAAAEGTAAIVSGRVVPSNWWRATEVLAGVERAGVAAVRELREAYETYRPGR